MYAHIIVATLFANMALAAPYVVPAHRRQATGQASFYSAAIPTASASQTSTGSSGPLSTGGAGSGSDTYTQYSGDGSAAAGWPDQSKWVSDFETMWGKNLPTIQTSCTPLGNPPDNSMAESNDVHDAIKSLSSTYNLDSRFVLAIMMQESKGCVRVHTTTGSHPNPGLMQSAGTATCNSGTPTNPCPQSTIENMISDGILGSNGLQATFAKSTGASNGQKFYQAAYLYNSGVDEPLGNLAAGASTSCYASDIANRLTGFLGNSPCGA